MKLKIIALAASAALSAAALAVPYNYAVWTSSTGSSASGTVGGVGVTFNGPLLNLLTNSSDGGLYYDNTPSDYTSSTVANAPSLSDNFVQLQGGNQNTYTVTFSAPVNNLVVSVLSVGNPGSTAEFDFNTSFTLLSQGTDEWGGSSSALTVVGDNLVGQEGSGSILFSGSTSSLSFTLPTYEYWYGFTVATPTPEPSTMSVFALGGLGLLIRRRKRA